MHAEQLTRALMRIAPLILIGFFWETASLGGLVNTALGDGVKLNDAGKVAESPDGKSPEQKAIEQMAARQQEFVGRLVELLSRRGAVVDFGNYGDCSELHYVALDYLLGKLVGDEERIVSHLEAARTAIHNDPPAATLIVELLAAEKSNLARLRDLATKAAAAVPA